MLDIFSEWQARARRRAGWCRARNERLPSGRPTTNVSASGRRWTSSPAPGRKAHSLTKATTRSTMMCNVFPEAGLQEPPPPIYVAATSPESFAWVGSRGLAVLLRERSLGTGGEGNLSDGSISGTSRRQQVRRTRMSPSFFFPQVLLLYLRGDRMNEATEVARRHIAEFLRFSESHYQRSQVLRLPRRRCLRNAPQQFPEFYQPSFHRRRRPTKPRRGCRLRRCDGGS